MQPRGGSAETAALALVEIGYIVWLSQQAVKLSQPWKALEDFGAVVVSKGHGVASEVQHR